jgi:hypothetical protein
MHVRGTKANRALKSAVTLQWNSILGGSVIWRFIEMDSLLQCLRDSEVVESQAQLKRTDTVLDQLCIIDFVHISVLEFEVRKGFSLRYHMRGVWFKANRLALIVLLNDVISNILEKFLVLLILGGLMQLLPFCSDFFLSLHKFPKQFRASTLV